MKKHSILISIIIVAITVSSLCTGCTSTSTKTPSLVDTNEEDAIIDYERNKDLLETSQGPGIFDLNGMELQAGDGNEVKSILVDYASYFGIEHCAEQLELSSENDVLGEKYYRYQQRYGEYPVYGKEVIVTSADDKIVSVIENTAHIENAVTTYKKDALQLICQTLDIDMDSLLKSCKWYLYDIEGQYTTAIAITTKYGESIIADANTGKIIKRGSMIDTVESVELELQGQVVNRKVNAIKEDDKYYLIDTQRNIYVYDLSKNNEYLSYDDKFDKGNLISFKNEKKCKNKSAVDALHNIEKVYDFYKEKLKHKSSDGKGNTTIRIFDGFDEYIDNKGKKNRYYDNAAAWGRPDHGTTEILISPRKRTTYANDLDVMGHEFTHSVIHYIIQDDFIDSEGDALNEGIADIMGLMIEAYYNEKHECDWKIGDARDYSSNQIKQKYTEFTKNTEEHEGGTIICSVAHRIWEGNPESKEMEPINDPKLLAELWYRTIMMISKDLNYGQCRTITELNALNMYRLRKITKNQYECILWAFDEAEIKFRLKSGVSNVFDQLGIFSNAYPANTDIFALVYDHEGGVTEEYNARVLNSAKKIVQETNGEPLVMNLSYGNYTIEIMEKESGTVVYRGLIRIRDFPDSVKEYFLDNELNILSIKTELGAKAFSLSEDDRDEDTWKVIIEDTSANPEVGDNDLEQYLNNMEIPVDIYTYFHHYSDTKKVDINDPYTFWMMLSFYATMQMDDEMYPSGSRLAERYLDDKYGQMLILSKEEVRDAVNAMMPGITEYPDYPNSQYLHYYEKDGNYYFPLIDLDTESARMTNIKVNDDGTATATAEAFTYYTGEIYETYQISLEKNDNININSPEPYPYCIKSISVFGSQDNTTQEVTPQAETGYEDGEVPPKVVSCWENTAIITKQGDLLMCGHNDYDKLGYDGNDSLQFLKVKDNVRDVFIGASDREELAIITKDNKLLIWNYFFGDEGFVPVLDNVDSFVSSYYFSAGYTNAAVTKDGKLYMWGEFYSPDGIGKVESEEPKHIMNNVKQISINEESIGVVTTEGNLLVWGNNENGQLGTGSTQDVTTSTNILHDISMVSIGEEHSAAIDKEGNLYTWGANRRGQLADGSTYSNFYPTIVMTDAKKVVVDEETTYVIDNSGKLFSCGSNFQGALGLGASYEDVQEVNKPTEIMTNVEDVSAMNETILVLSANGDVYGFGNNQYGQLGVGNTREYTFPALILNIDSYEAETSEERSAYIDKAVITDDTKIDLSFSQDGQLINVTLTVPGLDYYRTGEDFDIDVEFTDKYVVYKLDYDADDYGTVAQLLVSDMPNGSSMTYSEKTSAQRTINGDSITWSFDATQAGISLDSIKYSGYGIWHIVGLSSRYDSYTDARFATYENKGEELVQINNNNIIEYLYYNF